MGHTNLSSFFVSRVLHDLHYYTEIRKSINIGGQTSCIIYPILMEECVNFQFKSRIFEKMRMTKWPNIYSFIKLMPRIHRKTNISVYSLNPALIMNSTPAITSKQNTIVIFISTCLVEIKMRTIQGNFLLRKFQKKKEIEVYNDASRESAHASTLCQNQCVRPRQSSQYSPLCGAQPGNSLAQRRRPAVMCNGTRSSTWLLVAAVDPPPSTTYTRSSRRLYLLLILFYSRPDYMPTGRKCVPPNDSRNMVCAPMAINIFASLDTRVFSGKRFRNLWTRFRRWQACPYEELLLCVR
jgi:hypothetical protein